VILTRLDILDGLETLKICTSYFYAGEDYVRGEQTLRKGDLVSIAIPDLEVMEHCLPIYEDLPGWSSSIRDVRSYEDLPEECRFAIEFVEKEAGVNVVLASVGPNRDETIVVHPPKL
jgi:adenylosuccinate synthase